MELIDRDELMRKHTRNLLHDNSHTSAYELKLLIDCIEQMPIVDAQLVKHGSIIEFTDEERYKSFKDTGICFDGNCSLCGGYVWKDDIYCARCGAKLAEEV